MNGVLRSLILGGTVFGLAACGGGGGGGSDEGCLLDNCVDPVTITVSADRTALPLNLLHEGYSHCLDTPRVGSRYMTTLYVQAQTKSGKVLSGEDLFSFNVLSGFEAGQLYYLDGQEEHEAECTYIDSSGSERTIDVPAAFRFGTLDAASNGATMHLLSTDTAGTMVVEFSTTEPVSNNKVSQRVSVQVGGTPSGKPSQVLLNQDTSYLFVPGMGGATQTVIGVSIVDEAGQPVSAGTSANLLARIVPNTPAGTTALLRSGTVTGRSVTARSINGQAQIAVIAGANAGSFIVEFYADRSDNNVMNGLGETVYNAAGFYVYDYDPTTAPLAIETTTLPDAYVGTPYATMLVASGGFPDYQWAFAPESVRPEGLDLSASGVLSGTPVLVGDNQSFIVELYDARGNVVKRAFTINVKAEGGIPQLSITTESLPAATVATEYAAVLEVTGGKAPYTWEKVGTSVWAVDGGIVSGNVGLAGSYGVTVKVTDANGKTAQKSFSVIVN